MQLVEICKPPSQRQKHFGTNEITQITNKKKPKYLAKYFSTLVASTLTKSFVKLLKFQKQHLFKEHIFLKEK
jgi:hypothetical protein